MHATVKLIAAKTKVAPIKEQSILRLELCASVLLAPLMFKARATLNLESATVHVWTDSTIVLAWIKQHPSTWKTFIANRVAEIQTFLPKCVWRHVSTSNNPADCASRGMPVADLRDHSLWWHGPAWLSKPSANWPSSANLPPTEKLDLERRTTTTAHHVRIIEQSCNLAENVSSWPRLLRVTAYCMRFIARLRYPKTVYPTIALTADEVSLARMFWIKQAQSSAFAREIDALRKN
ncbi:hypothetical protein KPH14_000952 [Odynerus spinipes]|uniref:Uncharacterized protein n=1 Tax=Odynerus spinipes TaxID=1348599 RepID=A0AAD9RDZ2_9HYME|nr:hypothetical protein KPH14_000952 [Odynerus spinipes]